MNAPFISKLANASTAGCITAVFWVLSCLKTHSQVLAVTPKGVATTDIRLIPLFGDSIYRPISISAQVRAGQTAVFEIPPGRLPGEFMLRYDYRAEEKSDSYPTEQRILLGREGGALVVNPAFAAQPDSAVWLKHGTEQAVWRNFLSEVERRGRPLAPMRAWLEQETETSRGFYRKSFRAFERRRGRYNRWVDSCIAGNKGLFASHLMPLAYENPLTTNGIDPSARAAAHLSGIDLKDSLIIRSTHFRQHLDRYFLGLASVGKNAKEVEADLLKGTKALLDASEMGHPEVSGWMIDYLFEGLSASGLDEGFPMLASHLAGRESLSSRTDDIFRKAAAMGRLQTGMQAPDVAIPIDGSAGIPLHAICAGKPLTLLLFWSATCQHCTDLIAQLGPYTKEPSVSQKLQVVAVSVDREPHALEVWQRLKTGLTHWTHAISPEGVKGEPARSFGVLGTPQMFLLEGREARVLGVPETFDRLLELCRNGLAGFLASFQK